MSAIIFSRYDKYFIYLNSVILQVLILSFHLYFVIIFLSTLTIVSNIIFMEYLFAYKIYIHKSDKMISNICRNVVIILSCCFIYSTNPVYSPNCNKQIIQKIFNVKNAHKTLD